MFTPKKKILIIPSWYPTISNPLVGTFFREQAELVEDTFDVSILYGKKELISKSRFYLYKFFPKTFHANNPNNHIITPPKGVYFGFKQNSSFSEEKNFYLMLTSYESEFYKLINQGWKPDLIHAQSTVYAGIIAAFLGRKYNIPVIVTEHQIFLLHWYSKFIQSKIWNTLETVNKLLTVSNHQSRSILMNGVQCYPEVIGNLINEDLFPLKNKKPVTKFKILTITYPSPIKDAETFFKAISNLIERGHKDISATVIGNDSFENLDDANVKEFERLAVKYNVLEYCKLIAFIERDKLADIFNEHHVFVSTSVAETFGVAICEALVSGLPVISTKSGGVDDTVGEHNGLKVNIKDYKAIADAIIKIKANEVEYDPILLRKSVVEEYGKIAFKKKLINVYSRTFNT